ncbi:hypothetical protein NPIL_159251 [Nephila pilipes]|uniref:Uncharacterized protein n=1 Tax=Nephila pilipes TaxID=299642 RepID=A0A8X6MVB2_NEPPI|nr:hypothetical protein NPIL_159251 [Nephila pilipes]
MPRLAAIVIANFPFHPDSKASLMFSSDGLSERIRSNMWVRRVNSRFLRMMARPVYACPPNAHLMACLLIVVRANFVLMSDGISNDAFLVGMAGFWSSNGFCNLSLAREEAGCSLRCYVYCFGFVFG